tara:strand:+ start:619 stop:1896 length:1278 start_codon:yes stop_codon:yes gene_type:complete
MIWWKFNMSKYLIEIGKNAKKAFKKNFLSNNKRKNAVLNQFNNILKKEIKNILAQNKKDLDYARKIKLNTNIIDRLFLNKERIDQIRDSINKITKFKDPIGKIISTWRRPNGLVIKKITIPIGIIGVIFESRPNVSSDVASLCFKSGNTVILRGGSECINSNKILVDLFRYCLKQKQFDVNAVQLIQNQNRKLVDFFLSKMNNYLNVIIPRGGKTLVKKVQDKSRVPIIGHLEGICHIYIDKDADLGMAIKVIKNAKMRKTSNCNSLETLLIDKKIIKKFSYPILNELYNSGCKIIADNIIKKQFKKTFRLANEKDWLTEYLAPIISVKSVNGVDGAIQHINKYGTMHTDSIITKNIKIANKFLHNVKSSIALHNASTQFADGGEFGFGAEVGISTNNLPPRGPVGIEQLTSYKYLIYGKGQIRK